jgi:NTE family protein
MGSDHDNASERCSPITLVDTGSPEDDDPRHPRDGIALCLSGGGYRAMLFHFGALWRLNELRYLKKLARVSSVSGGSITAGVLGLKWSKLTFDAHGTATNYVAEVVRPIRALAGKTVDIVSVLGGAVLPGSIADRMTDAYRTHLFGRATLDALPDDPPRFVFNATNVQTAALFRFSKPYLADYRVGRVLKPQIEIAVAVAASSAFPPFLSPLKLELPSSAWANPSGHPSEDLHREPFLTDVVLTDGGLYDNLGLETAWKKYKTILVSDGGGKTQPEKEPKGDWVRHAVRVNDLIDNQVRSQRKRQVIGSFVAGERAGTYWGIRSHMADYQVAGALPCPEDKTTALANTRTGLRRLEEVVQDRIINWGYGISDAAMRKWVEHGAAAAAGFPYPASKVG